MTTEKQILINQILTDLSSLMTDENEKEISTLGDKVLKLQKMEDKEVEEAEGNEVKTGQVTEQKFMDALK